MENNQPRDLNNSLLRKNNQTLLTERYPWLLQFRVKQLRLQRSYNDWIQGLNFASTQSTKFLSTRFYKHKSLLLRRLGNSDMQLQYNKVTNLEIAVKPIDGLLIKPNQTFSLWHRVGEPTNAKGYLLGLQISQGKVTTGIGGGLCQLSNLLYWMALHSPLEITERHHHSFDPFPDHKRVIPFGTGASLFYNYIDLRFFNPTDITFQICLKVGETHLEGEMWADKSPKFSYHVYEKNHHYIEKDKQRYRCNEIWRHWNDRINGNLVKNEYLYSNQSLVMY